MLWTSLLKIILQDIITQHDVSSTNTFLTVHFKATINNRTDYETRDVNGTRISRVPKIFPVPGKKISWTGIFGKRNQPLWPRYLAGRGTLPISPAFNLHTTSAVAANAVSIVLQLVSCLLAAATQTPPLTAAFSASRRHLSLHCPVSRHVSRHQRVRHAAHACLAMAVFLLATLSCSLTIHTHELSNFEIYS